MFSHLLEPRGLVPTRGVLCYCGDDMRISTAVPAYFVSEAPQNSWQELGGLYGTNMVYPLLKLWNLKGLEFDNVCVPLRATRNNKEAKPNAILLNLT